MTDKILTQKRQKLRTNICDEICSEIKTQIISDETIQISILTNTDTILTNTDKNTDKEVSQKYPRIFTCNCGKEYKHRQSLFTHKKICLFLSENTVESKSEVLEDDSEFDKDKFDTNALIIQLLKQNQELQKSLIEISKEKVVTHNTNNLTHTNNKTFNLQFFLNEQCKDALNIGEFVDSIKIQLTDLEATGRQGYVEGITCIINKNLDKLDKFKRPIHCSDLKREVLYIKDNNEWIKEESNTPVLKKAIKQIANKNVLQINEWKKLHPGCTQSDSRKNDLYLNIVSNAMSGSTKEEQMKNYDKIVSNIIKGVVIEK
jgi:hypothetical protein